MTGSLSANPSLCQSLSVPGLSPPGPLSARPSQCQGLSVPGSLSVMASQSLNLLMSYPWNRKISSRNLADSCNRRWSVYLGAGHWWSVYHSGAVHSGFRVLSCYCKYYWSEYKLIMHAPVVIIFSWYYKHCWLTYSDDTWYTGSMLTQLVLYRLFLSVLNTVPVNGRHVEPLLYTLVVRILSWCCTHLRSLYPTATVHSDSQYTVLTGPVTSDQCSWLL